MKNTYQQVILWLTCFLMSERGYCHNEGKISKHKFLFLILLFFLSFCQKMSYLPDEYASIFLQLSSSEIKLGELVVISIQGEKGNGYPLPDGTIVYLNASRGTFPAKVFLQDGNAVAEFQADKTFCGDVEIKARSGQSQVIPETLIITVADQVVDSLNIWADPTQLPYGGGQSQMQVLALDALQKPVPGKIVFISTSAGTLSGGGARTTDANGRVSASLETKKAAIVTAKYKDLECSVSIQIASQNIKPIAIFYVSPTNPLSGETVTFNASASYDSDGNIVSYQWDFGDGISAFGKIVSHVYNVSLNRTFVVVLKVTDNDGGEGVRSENVTVTIKAP